MKKTTTPKQEAERSLEVINMMIADCMIMYDCIEEKFLEQIEREPQSWRGIGKGSDLCAIEDKVCELREMMKRIVT